MLLVTLWEWGLRNEWLHYMYITWCKGIPQSSASLTFSIHWLQSQSEWKFFQRKLKGLHFLLASTGINMIGINMIGINMINYIKELFIFQQDLVIHEFVSHNKKSFSNVACQWIILEVSIVNSNEKRRRGIQFINTLNLY